MQYFKDRQVLKIIVIILFSFVYASICLGADFTASITNNYGDIVVMEVEGNYDVNIGEADVLFPRQIISKEFIKNGHDKYDFIIIISNFDFKMPYEGAVAFHHGVKNNVQGIGIELFDNTILYGSNGRLQGIIDMGNISRIISDPLDPEFSETMRILSHEILHQWTAHIKFQKQGDNPSSKLIGLLDSHWSFLLDTSGSLMYGNKWIDNKNGTFTTLPGNKYFSQLDLYLMGLVDKSEVPPMLLIESPETDPARLPECSITIEGTADYISIDDIIATEGERNPGVTESEKLFRTGIVFITRPNTYTEEELPQIRSIFRQWVMWFSALT